MVNNKFWGEFVSKGKSTDGLMRHIRENHGITIEGSKDKTNLLNMGYYHGYKALRFIRNKENVQEFNKFNEIKAIYDFDLELKTIFYPLLIKIETSLKNRVIDYMVHNNAYDIEYIYKYKLTDYLSKPTGSKDYKAYLNKRLKLREKIDSSLAYNYGKGHPSIQHFFHMGKPIPLWAYFEVITFGEFGNFVSCLSITDRIALTEKMSIHHNGINQNGRILQELILCLTGLRNATMHNSMIFDCRFNKNDTPKQVISFIENQTGVRGITFNTITDYLVLLVYLSKKQNTTKTELKRIVRIFDQSRERLFSEVPFSTYSEIIGTDSNNKIVNLLLYISR